MSRCHPNLSTARAAGFTLIELLVVVAILGLLAALIIPAVAGARESSRRLACANRLKQIGLAMQTHQAATQTFPPPMPLRKNGKGSGWASYDAMSGYYELLPHLEQVALYNAINLAPSWSSGLTPACRENLTACQTPLAVLLCPSDSSASSSEGAGNSYRFNVNNAQPTGYRNMTTQYHRDDRGPVQAGAFIPELFSRAEDFADGLSTTVGFAERSIGGSPATVFDRRRDFWGAGLAGFFGNQSDDGVSEVCRSLRSSPPDYLTDFGTRWALAGCPDAWYNHVSTPNSAGADCVLGNAHSAEAGYCDFCSVAARSSHPGGVNCLMMDGSVRFVKDGIASPAWRAAGTRAGGEPATDW